MQTWANLVSDGSCFIWQSMLPTFLVLAWPNSAIGNTECYPPFGCFSTRYPFDHALMTLPQHPSEINSFFILHTRETEFTFSDLKNETLQQVADKIGTRKMKIIIHGLLESTQRGWMDRMKAELLKEDDYSIILVDWGKGASNIHATGNARLIGAQLGYMIMELKRMKALAMKDIHLIGFSLGAHAAGYAGKWTRKLGHKIQRITGLDPGDLPNGMVYENAHPLVRLDYQDADFVDTIHSDMTGLGLDRPIGHLDFYPNGGSSQAGCGAVFALIGIRGVGPEDFMNTIGCNHVRALDYYIESINSDCEFTGYPCQNYDKYERNRCRYCYGECPIMGHKANQIKDKHKFRGIKLYLMTNRKSPFCLKEKRSFEKSSTSWGNLFSDLKSRVIPLNAKDTITKSSTNMGNWFTDLGSKVLPTAKSTITKSSKSLGNWFSDLVSRVLPSGRRK